MKTLHPHFVSEFPSKQFFSPLCLQKILEVVLLSGITTPYYKKVARFFQIARLKIGFFTAENAKGGEVGNEPMVGFPMGNI